LPEVDRVKSHVSQIGAGDGEPPVGAGGVRFGSRHSTSEREMLAQDFYDASPEPGNPFYTVHGAFQANMIGGAMTGGNEPATLSLTF